MIFLLGNNCGLAFRYRKLQLFSIDENIPLDLKLVIQHYGYEVCDVYQQKLSGKSDTILLKRCKEEKYILITQDKDFENVYAYPSPSHAGIIVLRLPSQGVYSVTEAMKRLFAAVDVQKIERVITIVDKTTIRIREG